MASSSPRLTRCHTVCPQAAHGLVHGEVIGRRLVTEARAQFVRESNTPWRADGELFSSDGAVIESAMDGRTKIVYCKDGRRKEKYPNVKFDFLGYGFRPRWVKNSRSNELFC